MKKDILFIVAGGLVLAGLFVTFGLPQKVADKTTAKSTQQNNDKGGDTQNMMDDDRQAPDMEINENALYTATLKTSMGDIVIALTAKDTPMTVNNFVVLARQGFYDGTIFHRVIKDFMIQGGDPDGNGTGGPGYMFDDEFTSEEFDGPGIVAMANRGPDTNGSQFFITHAETPWLNGKHTIFGRVTKGMDVVDAIANVQVGAQDKPVKDVIVESIEIAEK